MSRRVEDRARADAIFYVLRTGGQWASLSETTLAAKSTAHDRFREWVACAVFERLWQEGVAHVDELVGLDCAWLSRDGAMIQAPLGGDATGPNQTDRGKSGTKRSLLTEAHGVPVALAVDGANRNDRKLVRPTLAQLISEPPTPTDESPQGMCLDKG